MTQAVCCQPLTAEVRVRNRISPCGICAGQSGNGTGFYPSLQVSPWLSILMYHLGGEQ
jgi:hypothetical protein